ncbi:MAG: TfoX/Sxy family protein [Deltaproteobacteria bacterium]|nr:MAG: TfoX/Sxy family protein [Deltaproteobacteria bacterium]
MAYNEKLSQKVRALLQRTPGMEDKKMFGGVGFLVHGNMACGVLNDDLIVRVGPDEYKNALALPHTREFDITGRVMKGWVMVSSEGTRTDRELSAWVQRGILFAQSLPGK